MNNQTCNHTQTRLTRTRTVKSSARAGQFRKVTCALASCLLGALLLTGCAKTKVVDRQRLVYEQLPRPNHIYVYDFSASPADVAKDSELAGQAATVPPPSAELAEIGRNLGGIMGAQLVDSIREMGLPAERGVFGQNMQPNDVVIRGYLVSVDPGSAAKRMTIGFGSGAAELATFIEGYQVKPQGLRKLGSAMVNAQGNKSPGAAAGAAGWAITGSPIGFAVTSGMKIYGEASGRAGIEGRAKQTAKEIAERLKSRFQEEGWISR